MSDLIPQSATIPNSDYVIFGGTGDLALRKIFPALLWRYCDGQIDQHFRLVAVARNPLNREEFAEKLRPFCADVLVTQNDAETVWQGFLNLLSIQQLDIVSGQGSTELAAFLLEKAEPKRPLIFYLAVAPDLFGPSCACLQAAGLVLPQSRLVVEKPLGHDFASAEQISKEIRTVFDESQIYRIDHYLGKETVQNLMALRFANVIFEALWNNRYIDNIQITVAEPLEWAIARLIMINMARLGICSRTTCCNCFVWWRWNRRHDLTPIRSVTKNCGCYRVFAR